MRLLRLAAILIATACLVAGAAATEEESATPALRVGTAADYPPFHQAGEGGEPSGFDIDIARALCAEIGRECSFAVGQWDNLIEDLVAGEYDMVVASIPITEARANEVIFTRPYYRSPLAIVAAKSGGPGGNDAAALAGKRLGAQQMTAAARQLPGLYPDANGRTYPTLAAALADLARGNLDAVLGEAGLVSLWLRSQEGACCAFVGETAPASSDAMGIALRPGDEQLRDRLDAALDAIVADGTYTAINARYFPFPIR